MSVLTRIASNEHKHIKITQGDTVIVSAKAIPGNEKAVGRIINSLFKRGASVYYDKVSDVHVSGHASGEELKLMINIVRPAHFVPIHGEYRHLVYHANIAKALDVPEEAVFILQNGDILEISENGITRAGTVATGRMFFDGKGLIDMSDIMFKERRRLAQDGVVLVLISISKETGELVCEPEIISKGLAFETVFKDTADEARKIVQLIFNAIDKELVRDTQALQAKVQTALKKLFRYKMEKRPIIMPLVVEV